MLQGMLPVLPTPFTEAGAVDPEAMAGIVDFALACGVDGVISNDPRIFDAVGEPLYDRCRQ